jgi:hypothetical protein
VAVASTAYGAKVNNNKIDIAEQPSGSELIGDWHLVRTSNPHGGADAVSIIHTADPSRSDFDLAGLTIRCGKVGPEALIVLLRSFSLRDRLKVVFGRPGSETQFDATVAAPGTAVLVSTDARRLVTVSWQDLKDLFIRLEGRQTTINGVVTLAGMQPAFKLLMTSCPTQ